MMRSLILRAATAAIFLATATAHVQQLQFLVPDFDKDTDLVATTDEGSTHYGPPKDGCQDDETAFSIMGVSGSVCSPACTDSPCPVDVPDGVTATPTCALQNPQTGDKYCALICAPMMLRTSGAGGQCGAATCQPISGTGICTYE
jgi:hypothetical protein